MSAFQTAYERNDQARSVRQTAIFAGKVLFALALVLTATIALVRTEILISDVQHLDNPELVLMLE